MMNLYSAWVQNFAMCSKEERPLSVLGRSAKLQAAMKAAKRARTGVGYLHIVPKINGAFAPQDYKGRRDLTGA